MVDISNHSQIDPSHGFADASFSSQLQHYKEVLAHANAQVADGIRDYFKQRLSDIRKVPVKALEAVLSHDLVKWSESDWEKAWSKRMPLFYDSLLPLHAISETYGTFWLALDVVDGDILKTSCSAGRYRESPAGMGACIPASDELVVELVDFCASGKLEARIDGLCSPLGDRVIYEDGALFLINQLKSLLDPATMSHDSLEAQRALTHLIKERVEPPSPTR